MSYAGTPAPDKAYSTELASALGALSEGWDTKVSGPTSAQDGFHLAAHRLHGMPARLEGLWPTDDVTDPK